jgi:hypothetical protein
MRASQHCCSEKIPTLEPRARGTRAQPPAVSAIALALLSEVGGPGSPVGVAVAIAIGIAIVLSPASVARPSGRRTERDPRSDPDPDLDTDSDAGQYAVSPRPRPGTRPIRQLPPPGPCPEHPQTTRTPRDCYLPGGLIWPG